jgi:hypothetical protein
MPTVSKSTVYELGVETAKILNEKQNELRQITWTDGESNLDTEYSRLACDCCEVAWNIMKTRESLYDNVDITCEKPDINITFRYSDGGTSKDKIELKISKSKKLSGSTIRNLDINQTLIYCLRPSSDSDSEPYKIKCSQYYSAMGESDVDLFQDRTPRPFISFDKMNEIRSFHIREKDDWIEHYAKCAVKRIEEPTICQKSWQDDLIIRVKRLLVEEYVRNTSEQQFNKDKTSLSKMTFT